LFPMGFNNANLRNQALAAACEYRRYDGLHCMLVETCIIHSAQQESFAGSLCLEIAAIFKASAIVG
jgi:hypothetical protein